MPSPRDAEAENARFRRMTRVSFAVLALILAAFAVIGYGVFYSNLFAYRPHGIVTQRTVPLAFTRPGRLRTLYAEEGMAVKKGDPVARLSDTSLRAEIKEAEAALDRGRAELGAASENLRMRAFELDRSHGDTATTLKIDEDSLGTTIKDAQAGLERLRELTNGRRTEYERAQNLLASKTIPQQEFDRIKTDFDSHRKELENREKHVESLASTGREGAPPPTLP
jgi:multidrug resistance efflux pump